VRAGPGVVARAADVRPWSSSIPGCGFAAVDLGASSIDVEITDGRLETDRRNTVSRPTSARAPKVILRRVNEILAKLKAEGAAFHETCTRSASGVPGPGELPPTACRYRRRSCLGWGPLSGCVTMLAREYGCPVVVDNDVNIMAIGERYGGRGRDPSTTCCS